MIHKYPINDHEYRSALGIPQSVLKGFNRCPAYVQYLESEHRRPPTDNQALGLYVEHKLFGTAFRHVISPYDSFRTNEAKGWRAEKQAENYTVLKQEQVDAASAMIDALNANPIVRQLIRKGRASVALFGNHSTGLLRKGLIDWVPDDIDAIVDLKTTADASERGFGLAVARFRYDVQAASYAEAFEQAFQERRKFVFICVENTEPYLTATWTLQPEQLASAMEQYHLWMRRYAECCALDQWPQYTNAVQMLEVPRYIQTPVEPL